MLFAIHSCNKLDNCIEQTWYQDTDGDGFGATTVTKQSCDQPIGYVSDNTDCDDTEFLINPNGQDNVLNGVDNNCNGVIDEEVNNVKYRVEIISTWNSQSPAWPDLGAHFSWLAGATHNANANFWKVGTLASPGIDEMSITGTTYELVSEIQTEINKGNVEKLINIRHWICPDEISHPSCGENTFDIIVSKNFSLFTLVSMLGPSPDWFIGVESLSLVDSDGTFTPEIVHELYPYDAGILSDNSVLNEDCCEREPLSLPQENIHLITTESGEAIGPNSLG